MKNIDIFIPFIKEINYVDDADIIPQNCIIYGRLKNDFQMNCLLFSKGKNNVLKSKDVKSFREKGFKVCYSYDKFDFENMEFTMEGFKNIIKDINKIIAEGFTHILAANPFIIEIVCNEFKNKINLVISSQLEINSPRGKIFFEVLNDMSPISHLVVSQNQLNEWRLKEMLKIFSGINIVLEIDRFASDNQIVHEHYYNILYGYYNNYAMQELKKFLDDNRHYCKKTWEMLYPIPGIGYKIGEINANTEIVLNNLRALLNGEKEGIRIIDFHMW